MKYFLVSAIVILFGALSANGQNPKLNKYTFGEGLTFSGNKGYSMNLRGYAQPMVETKNFELDSGMGSQSLTRFRMRRLRFRLTGEAKEQKIDYRFQFDLSGSSEVGEGPSSFLLDAWVRYKVTKRIKISFGQKATTTDNRELTMGSQTLQLVERSRLTSAFSSIREFGIFVDGNFKTGKGSYLRPSIAITNGDGLNVNGRDFGGLKYGGRVDFLPFGLFTRFGQFRQGDLVRENAPKLVVGANYSINQGMTSRRGRESGRFLYANDLNSNGIIEGDEERLPDFTKYGVDFLFKYKGFSILGEFVQTSVNVSSDINLRNDSYGNDPNRLISSFNSLTAEEYVQSQLMLGQGYNIQAGYIFKRLWSVDARYTHIAADKHSFLNNGTFYDRPNYYTLGTTKYFGKSYGVKVQGSLTYVDTDEGALDGNRVPVDGNEWIGRIITSIAF